MRVFKPAFCGAPAPAFSTLLKASRSKTDAFNVDLELSHIQLKSNSRLVYCPVSDCGGRGGACLFLIVNSAQCPSARWAVSRAGCADVG